MGEKGDLPIRINEVLFFLKGGLRFTFSDLPEHSCMSGEMLLLPAGGRYRYEAIEKTVVLIFKMEKPIHVCETLSIADFYKHYFSRQKSNEQNEPHFSVLEMRPRMQYFVEGVANCITDGVCCRRYADLVIREYIVMLSVYYSKEELCGFLYYLQVSEDITFEEHVRRQWHIYKNVEEIAEAMWMTPRKFSSRFKEVFGLTPYRWMKENRARLIEKELTTTDKLIKQVAFEQGFDNKSQFAKFCNTELGASPTEIRARKSDQTK